MIDLYVKLTAINVLIGMAVAFIVVMGTGRIKDFDDVIELFISRLVITSFMPQIALTLWLVIYSLF